jgi:hypothetical protein
VVRDYDEGDSQEQQDRLIRKCYLWATVLQAQAASDVGMAPLAIHENGRVLTGTPPLAGVRCGVGARRVAERDAHIAGSRVRGHRGPRPVGRAVERCPPRPRRQPPDERGHPRIATRARCDPQTQDYIAARRPNARPNRNAIRCLNRHLARRVWNLLRTPASSQASTHTMSFMT